MSGRGAALMAPVCLLRKTSLDPKIPPLTSFHLLWKESQDDQEYPTFHWAKELGGFKANFRETVKMSQLN